MSGPDAGRALWHTRAMAVTKESFARARRDVRRALRRDHYRAGLRPMALAGWNTSKEHNVGSLVRTAHAAAAAEVVLVGDREWNIEAAKTADLYTDVVILPDEDAFLVHLETAGFQLVSVELHERSVSLFDAEFPDRPCFLLGAEIGGVPKRLIDASEVVVQIPQWGLVPSLNLAVAGSIVLYHYLARLHAAGRLDRPEGGLMPRDDIEP
jgi:tRNA G18 (ribose-2'-O)-methylase SpoU